MVEHIPSVVAVVVTYNRRQLLSRCLLALLNQTRPPDHILVVDNASTDGTPAMLAADFPGVSVLSLPQNIGGSGGFAAGMEWAGQRNYDWLWLMDDDLWPHPEALEHLVQAACKMKPPVLALIGGLPQDPSGQLIWGAKLSGKWVTHTTELPENDTVLEVNSLAFLGLLVPARAISEVGLPRTDFFVYLDDMEYCYRARRKGYNIVCVPRSKLFHPLPERRTWQILGKVVFVERFPAWKGYYDVRNRILLGLEYESLRFWYHLLPVIFLRMMLSLILYREDRQKKFQLFMLGLWDGLRKQTGRRITP